MTLEPRRDLDALIADVDVEIRPLVALLNRLPGICTTDSCAGHASDEPAYVSFLAKSQDALLPVLRALPFWGTRTSLIDNRPQWRSLWFELTLHGGGAPWYHLRLAGSPQFVQRQVIGEVEAGLLAQVGTPRSCPTYETVRSAGSQPYCP